MNDVILWSCSRLRTIPCNLGRPWQVDGGTEVKKLVEPGQSSQISSSSHMILRVSRWPILHGTRLELLGWEKIRKFYRRFTSSPRFARFDDEDHMYRRFVMNNGDHMEKYQRSKNYESHTEVYPAREDGNSTCCTEKNFSNYKAWRDGVLVIEMCEGVV